MDSRQDDSIPLIRSERDIVEYFFDSNISTPFRVILEVTYRCNARCIHCYAPPPEPYITELTPAEWKNVIQTIGDMGVFRVIFTGGEPLFRDDLFDMIRLSHDQGMLTFLETNGSLINEKNARKLVQSGVNIVNISINRCNAPLYDAFSGHKGLFDKAVNALKILKEYPIETAVFTTINRLNIKEIPKIIDLAADIGVNRIAFVHISPSGRAITSEELFPTPEEYITVIKEIQEKENQYPDLVIKYPNLPAYYFKKSIGLDAFEKIKLKEGYIERCTAGITSFVIDPAGNIKPCTQTVAQAIGNVKTDSLQEIWLHSPILKKLRSNKKEMETPCRNCALVSQCTAGHRCLDYQLENLAFHETALAAPLCNQCYEFMETDKI
jgi:radical SAM protein with 4Fe4S-binding SPASM domain